MTNRGKKESGLRHLKKFLGILGGLLLVGSLFMLTGCSEEKALFLDVPTSIEADTGGNVTIKGKTLPDTDVKIGLGIIGDSTTSDEKGNFSLKYELSSEDESSTIKITAKSDDDKKTKSVTVKPNAAKMSSQKAASSSSESAAKASESSASASSQADQAKIEAVAKNYTTSYQVKFQDYTVIYLINEKTKTIAMTTSDEPEHVSTSQYTGNFNDGIDFNMDGLAMHAHYHYVDQPAALIVTDESGNENKAVQIDPATSVQYYHLYK
ncbi:hypothetical protein [Lacticaseibacillus yichunensis]|uniref:Lipoprotein n=1 Tax=Lacticaseibacillus yichunensis TaxID=2486015 RepID=A0ABW4CQE7_9LACO